MYVCVHVCTYTHIYVCTYYTYIPLPSSLNVYVYVCVCVGVYACVSKRMCVQIWYVYIYILIDIYLLSAWFLKFRTWIRRGHVPKHPIDIWARRPIRSARAGTRTTQLPTAHDCNTCPQFDATQPRHAVCQAYPPELGLHPSFSQAWTFYDTPLFDVVKNLLAQSWTKGKTTKMRRRKRLESCADTARHDPDWPQGQHVHRVPRYRRMLFAILPLRWILESDIKLDIKSHGGILRQPCVCICLHLHVCVCVCVCVSFTTRYFAPSTCPVPRSWSLYAPIWRYFFRWHALSPALSSDAHSQHGGGTWSRSRFQARWPGDPTRLFLFGGCVCWIVFCPR